MTDSPGKRSGGSSGGASAPKADTEDISVTAIMRLYPQTLDALRNDRILKRGGVFAYIIYAFLILMVFFIAASVLPFTNLQTASGQVLLAAVALLGVGTVGVVALEFIKFKREALAAELAARARTEILEAETSRSGQVFSVAQAFFGTNSSSFERVLEKNTNFVRDMIVALDQGQRDVLLAVPVNSIAETVTQEDGVAST